ncbi:MAG: hypothetical protein MI923_16150 [Phycisphaerales bacterium]|nr:hypothetical protein [Phycisphaerales bacterium]
MSEAEFVEHIGILRRKLGKQELRILDHLPKITDDDTWSEEVVGPDRDEVRVDDRGLED